HLLAIRRTLRAVEVVVVAPQVVALVVPRRLATVVVALPLMVVVVVDPVALLEARRVEIRVTRSKRNPRTTSMESFVASLSTSSTANATTLALSPRPSKNSNPNLPVPLDFALPIPSTVPIPNYLTPSSLSSRSEEHTSELQSREKLVC